MPTIKSRKPSRKPSRKSSRTSSIRGESETAYNAWKDSVLADLSNTKKSTLLTKCGTSKCGLYTLLPRVFMVLDFDTTSANEFVASRKPTQDSFQLYNLRHPNQENTKQSFVRKPMRTSTKEKKRCIASDLRGLTFYICKNTGNSWYNMGVTDTKALHLEGADTTPLTKVQIDTKATLLIKHIKKLLGLGVGKTSTTLTGHIERWVHSVYTNLGTGDKVTIRLATIDGSLEGVKQNRLFIPAKVVRNVIGKYYTHNSFVKNKNGPPKRTYKANTVAECADTYLAVNVDTNGNVASTANLSINEPHVDVLVDNLVIRKA